MAWNPTPKVAAARDFGNKFRKDKVVIISIDYAAGTLEATTFGKTRAMCAEAEKLGNVLCDAAYKFMEENE